MVLHKVFAVAVGLVVSLIALGRVDGCSCPQEELELCQYVEDAPVVIHATVTDRSDQVDINDDVTYTVNILNLFKGEPEVRYAQDITFVTGGNSAACGVNLDIGVEYLITLYRVKNVFDPKRDGQLVAGLCDLVSPWDDISDEDKDTLELGCDFFVEEDPCKGDCGDIQVCMLYTEGSYEEYYCADACDPSPCVEGATCTLQDVKCVQAPCAPIAVCEYD